MKHIWNEYIRPAFILIVCIVISYKSIMMAAIVFICFFVIDLVEEYNKQNKNCKRKE